MEKTDNLPSGYRMTELGPLPEEWRVVKLGEVVKLIKGEKPNRLLTVPEKGALPYLTANFFRTRIPEKFVPKDESKKLPVCNPEDLVMIWDGSKAGQIFTGLRGVLASTMVRLDPIVENLDKLFMYMFLITQFEFLNSQTTGTTIPHVNKQLFKNLPIPLPPLPEQKAIAYVLRTVQSAKEATEKVISSLRELKKSLMKHLFTYGPVPVDEREKVELREAEKDTGIGKIPVHWKVVRLGEVFDIQQGKQLSRKRKNKNGEIECKFLRTSNVLWEGITLQNLDIMHITKKELEKLKVRKGDIFVCEGGDVGRTAILEDDIDFNLIYQNHLHRLRPKSINIYSKFFVYWMEKYIRIDKVHIPANVTTIPNLSASRLKSFSVPLPPLDEQHQIARILQTVDQKIEAEKKRKETLENLFKSLLHNLMTAKKRLPREFIKRFEGASVHV